MFGTFAGRKKVELYTNLRAGEKGAWLSIGTYIFLSAIKLIIGYLGASEALRADGLNNSTDIISSIAVLIGLRISQRPPMKIINMAICVRKRLLHWSLHSL